MTPLRAPRGSSPRSADFGTIAGEEAEARLHAKELQRKLALAEQQVAHVAERAREAALAFEFKDQEAERARSTALLQSKHLIGVVRRNRLRRGSMKSAPLKLSTRLGKPWTNRGQN